MNKNNALCLPVTEDENVKSKYYLFGSESNTAIGWLPNYSKINIFIGANNSGKSRFMRYLMKNSLDLVVHNLSELIELVNEHNELVQILDIHWKHASSRGFVNKEVVLNKTHTIYLYHYDRENKELNQNLQNLNVILKNYNQLHLYYSTKSGHIITKPNKDSLVRLKTIIEKISEISSSKTDLKPGTQQNIYIPTLRSAHSFYNSEQNRIQDNLFLSSINKHHSLDKYKDKLEVFTGLDLYDEILIVRNSKSTIRRQFEKFEKFVSINFFNGKPLDIVATLPNRESIDEGEKVITIYFEGEEDRKLHELGDGIQAIIILMYKIFMAKKNSIIYIDEPELNLHPGMQRLFLEQLSRNKVLSDKNLTYFIATHSNHLLDISIEQDDISIYTFSSSKDLDKKIIRNVNNGDNATLRELGVNNTSVFMANCAIWVEGVSDRNYLKAFLNAYHMQEKTKKMPLEDLDFAFFEYSGSNIAHYLFEKQENELLENKIKAFALSNRIFLIADSDNSKKSSKKGKRLLEIEGTKTDSFFPKIIWDYREIENLLPNSVWDKVLIEFRNKIKFKEDTDNTIQTKISNGLKVLNSLNYKKVHIGEFLNKLEVDNNITELNRIYDVVDTNNQTTYGTIKSKKELSHVVLNKVLNGEITWSDFKENEEIVKLTHELIKFIKRQ